MNDTAWEVVFVGSGDPKFDTFPDIQTGGSGPVWRLARKYTERGHNVTIFAGTYNERYLQDDSGVTIINLSVTTLPTFLKRVLDRFTTNDDISQSPGKAIERLFGRLWFSYQVSREIELLDPDGVFLRSRFTGYFPSRLEYPSIFTIKSPDACDFFYDRTVSRHPANRLLFHYKQYLEEAVIRNSDYTVVMNEVMKEYFRSKGYSDIEVISLGIETDEIIENLSRERANQTLYVGRFDGNKRPEWLIDAYTEIEHNDYELHFIGSGPRERYLKKLVEKRGMIENVVFHGRIPRSEVLKQMRRAQVLVLPSEFENCPNVIVEAMASGCAVIASDTNGGQEIINDQVNGLLFDKRNPSELTENLVSCIKNERLRYELRRNALQYIKTNHTADQIADRYWSVFEKVSDL